MKTLIQTLFYRIASKWRERWHLSLELIALRHQVVVLKRSCKRPQFSSSDRCFWLLLSSWWSRWPQALEIIQADTVRRRRRQGIWHHLKWKREREQTGCPPIPDGIHNLIRDMSRDNRLWGTPRIQGELAKLGIKVSRTTVAKYIDRRSGPPSLTWRTFWRMHAPGLHVHEIYTELSGRIHVMLTRIFRACRWGLWGLVSSWVCRCRCHLATPCTEPTDLVSVPVGSASGSPDPVMVSERSPPALWQFFTHKLLPADWPMEMGGVDLCLRSSAMDSWVASPTLSLTSQADCQEQRTGDSEQAVA
jgi:hypothetical protein